MGLLFCFLATIAFGLLGCVAKVAERRQVRSSMLVVVLFGWATLAMLVRTLAEHTVAVLPVGAALVAGACGICAAVAFLAFQSSIQVGHVAVAWLMMNLSSVVPAIASAVIYDETFSAIRMGALGLAVVSLFLLFQGKRQEEKPSNPRNCGKKGRRWTLLMALILATNGMASFGLRVIANWGLAETIKFPYLTVWYGAGLASIGLPTLLKRLPVRAGEIGWAGLMAALSIGGQVAMATALQMHMPGHVVFPIAVGGSVFIVALAGWVFFRERMSTGSAAGMVSGFAAVVLLGIG